MNDLDVRLMNGQTAEADDAWLEETLERIALWNRYGDVKGMSDKALGIAIRHCLNAARTRRLTAAKRLAEKYQEMVA